MNMNNDMANARFESVQERIASRAGSRAVSPSTLQAKLKAKIKAEPIDLATGTPRAYAATRISFKTPSTTDTPNKDFLPSKLTTPYKGPYVVLSQYKNDVTCKHANVVTVQVFHIDRIKPFCGSLEEATALAQIDYQQFVVLNITAYQGDPEKRSEMEFLLEYEDGTISWKSWDKDLFDSLPYEGYVRSIPQLRPLLLTVALSNKQAAITNRTPILIVRPALIGYMDLRWFSFDWYATLGLPNEDTTTYVLKYRYGDWTHENHRKIRIKFDITDTEYTINHYSVLSWGTYYISVFIEVRSTRCLLSIYYKDE